ncbi:hypothetical protein HOK51_01295 [Candidatus Woesearchaeota archaeon]|jgi:hypothetical protein|nr:hypothetical protein [Candidatus Woesearchaeota archaeon]MBT6518449.1 hypothetical protein [Candidatus Woesearchaeota archaeon]MBT7366930.1 hypothetical protein [Candidatus Woesearchaeota archaeon]
MKTKTYEQKRNERIRGLSNNQTNGLPFATWLAVGVVAAGTLLSVEIVNSDPAQLKTADVAEVVEQTKPLNPESASKNIETIAQANAQETDKSTQYKTEKVIVPQDSTEKLEVTITGTQLQIVPYKQYRTNNLAGNVSVTYVFAKEGGEKHTFIYLQKDPVSNGVANISYKPSESGKVTAQEIINKSKNWNKFTPLNPDETFKAEGIIEKIEYSL